MNRPALRSCLTALSLMTAALTAAAQGDSVRGAKAFNQCAACHSVTPRLHLTGPSLAAIWNQKAGTAEGFTRYSEAFERSRVVWSAETLDAWLRNPAQFIPGNQMPFRGIADAQTRADLIAYLKAVSEEKAAAPAAKAPVPSLPDLKQADASRRVTAIRYCGDTYRVTTAAQKELKFWEFNLRFKTDSTAHGPQKGHPVLVGQGMGGDRAQVVFASPSEISAFIRASCP